MEIVTILVVVVLVILALALIIFPLWQQTRPEALFQVDRTGQTLEEYEARYQATLASIKDLMFDHEMGKVSTEDYETLLTQAKLEAAAYRKEIDRLSSDSPALDTALDAQIETLISQARSAAGNGSSSSLLQEVNAEIELLKDVQPVSQNDGDVTCPTCGKTVQAGDAFCAGCGQSLAEMSQPQTNFCSQCGAAVHPDDTFCAACGHALKPTVHLSSS